MSTRVQGKKAQNKASTSTTNRPNPPTTFTRSSPTSPRSIEEEPPLQNPLNPHTNNYVPIQPQETPRDHPLTMDQCERPVGDYIAPTIGHYGSPICLPEGDEEFEIKYELLNMVASNQFEGFGNPYSHLTQFTEICQTLKMPGVHKELVFMRVFPFSLGGKAKRWLTSHGPNTFHTWESLAQAFLFEYFPPEKLKRLIDQINHFTQDDGESFYEAYERFKDLQRECPHHGLNKWQLLQYFYDGMDKEARNQMDNASAGGIMDLTATEGFKIIEKLARNSHQWGGDRNHLRRNRGSSKENNKEDFHPLTKTVNSLDISFEPLNKKGNVPRECGACGSLHHDDFSCTQNRRDIYRDHHEEVNFIGKIEEKTYIPLQTKFYDQRNTISHMKFHENPLYAESKPREYEQRQEFQSQNQKIEETPLEAQQGQEKASLLSLMTQLASIQAQMQKDNQLILLRFEQRLDEMQAHNEMLEKQVSQANSIFKTQGKRPMEVDESNIENINAITLKSGKVLEEPRRESRISKPSIEVEKVISIKDKGEKEQHPTKEKLQEPTPYMPPIPFPQRQKKKKEDAQFKRFGEILKKLHVTLPFTEVLSQMPTYAKFLKDIMSHRREISELEHVTLDANCSAIIQQNMPRKLDDHGSFSIPIFIGGFCIKRALCDLGASISLMPYSLFKKLDMGELTPTNVNLRLADRSSRSPIGILEDVPIKIGNSYVPIDFYVLEMNVESEIPIILGRPFLNTVKALIDCGEGTIKLNLGNETLKFDFKNIKKTLSSPMDCHMIIDFSTCDGLTPCELESFEVDLARESFVSMMNLDWEDVHKDNNPTHVVKPFTKKKRKRRKRKNSRANIEVEKVKKLPKEGKVFEKGRSHIGGNAKLANDVQSKPPTKEKFNEVRAQSIMIPKRGDPTRMKIS